jgi:hypothetical protein
MLEEQEVTHKAKVPTTDELIEKAAASASVSDQSMVTKLTQKDMDQEVVWITLTPGAAGLLLRDHNGSNREFKPGKANEYARVMKRGGWQRNKETMAMDVTGALRDGQNRCLAVLIADSDIEIGVMLGETVTAPRYYDGGQPRSAGDILHMGGIDDPALRARIVKTAANYEQRLRTGKSTKMDRTEQVEHAEKHGTTLATAIGLARRSREKPEGQSPSFEPCLDEIEAATVAFLALGGGWTAPEIGSFLAELQLGVGEGENHPIEQAATRLIDDSRNKTRKRTMNRNQRLSLTFEALNLRASNKRKRLAIPKPKALASFDRPANLAADLLGDGMPLAKGSERGDH